MEGEKATKSGWAFGLLGAALGTFAWGLLVAVYMHYTGKHMPLTCIGAGVIAGVCLKTPLRQSAGMVRAGVLGTVLFFSMLPRSVLAAVALSERAVGPDWTMGPAFQGAVIGGAMLPALLALVVALFVVRGSKSDKDDEALAEMDLQAPLD